MAIESIVAQNKLPQQTAKNGDVMGKDDFMKLLLMQMRHQDPLKPVDNQDMLAQLAQFSSLEQMSNLNDNLVESNNARSFMDATRLLGKEVELIDPSSSEGNIQRLSAVVKTINQTTNGPLLTLDNGLVVSPESILTVRELAQE
jgi:flagellar basal-body rod modification protein FlgD